MPPCCHLFFVLIAGRKGSPVCFQPHLSGEQCRGSGVLRQLRWTCCTGRGLSITQKNSHPADYPGLGLTGNKGSWHWSCMKPGWSLPRMQSTGRRRRWGLYEVCQCTFYSCLWIQCCFMSTETIRLIRDWGAQDGHLDFRMAPELWMPPALRVLHILSGGLEHSGSTQEVSAFLYALLHHVTCVAVGRSIGGICSLHGAAQKDESLGAAFTAPKRKVLTGKGSGHQGRSLENCFPVLWKWCKRLYN